jgi:hypothetical protein
VTGVDVPVGVGLDHAVGRDDAEAADDLRMVRDLLGAKQNAVPEILDVVVEPLRPGGAKREGGSRGEPEDAWLK